MDNHKTQHIAALDGLRGIAASLVLLGHSTASVYGNSAVPRKHLAVAFFWMLSGYVISKAYGRRLNALWEFRAYITRRIVRLYPLIMLRAFTGITSQFLTTHRVHFDATAITATVAAALAVPVPIAPFSTGHFPVNPPSWSLFPEMIASVLFGLILYRLQLRIMFVACLMIGVTGVLLLSRTTQFQDFGPSIAIALAVFMIGIMLQRWSERLRRLPVVPFWVPALILCGATVMPLSWNSVPESAIVLLLFPTVIVMALNVGRHSQMMHWAGELSYPVYILHWPVLMVAERAFLGRVGPVATAMMGMGGSVVFAFLALTYFDRPVRKLLGRLTSAALDSGSPIASASRKVAQG